MYEHRRRPVLSGAAFRARLVRHMAVAFGLLTIALGLGVLGYRLTEGLPWLDALLNASMILGGMGPVDQLKTPAGKVFASFYALFSGLVFLAFAGVLLAPIAHRLFHQLHVDEDEAESSRGGKKGHDGKGP